MFIWKVEDMALTNEIRGLHIKDYPFHAEFTTSREDKIAFLDQFTEDKMSYILQLVEQFSKDAIKMPRDMWDAPKTVSIIGWVKRNDKKYRFPIIDINYHYGLFNICGTERYIQNANAKGPYDMHDDLVDECFHRQLKQCLSKETDYFKTHDEYEVAKANVRKKSERYGTTFGIQLCFSSSGAINVVTEEDHFHGPEITLEQCYTLLDAYEKVEKYIATLSEEISSKA